VEKKDFTILYVDDETHNLISFRATFRREYPVLTASSGKEAMAVLRDREVHLVIADQRMPEMTGVELLETILPLYPETIRILLTGYSDIEAVIDAINKGQVYRYMNKPWDERDMRLTIENARQLYGLKKETLKAQFETLKSQVNPHFLFNNLNVLSSLIHVDPEAASRFVRQLSKVYRYVLENKDADTVSLEEELAFLEAYAFLLETRFGDSFRLNIRIPADCRPCRVPPAVIQMLVENAIKHNVIARAKPLHVDLLREDNYLVISNNLQRKSSVEHSSRIGLQNIMRRYEFLSSARVIVEETGETFSVKIPIL
jgi:sensor histidine kinase YesM